MALTEKEITVLRLRGEGLTQIEVAERLNVSQAAISDFEKNANRKLQDAKETLLLAKELEIEIPESQYERLRRRVRR